jgi:hypothetical protein
VRPKLGTKIYNTVATEGRNSRPIKAKTTTPQRRKTGAKNNKTTRPKQNPRDDT